MVITRKLELRYKLISLIVIILLMAFLASLYAALVAPREETTAQYSCDAAISSAERDIARSQHFAAFDTLLDAYDQCPEEYSLKVSSTLAYAYRDKGDLSNALSWHQRSLVHASAAFAKEKSPQNRNVLARTFTRVAYAHEGLKAWKAALEKHNKALALFNPSSDSHQNSRFAVANINQILWLAGEGKDYFEKAITSLEALTATEMENKSLPFLGISCLYASVGDLEKFSQNVVNAASQIKELKDVSDTSKLYDYLSGYILNQGDWKFIPTYPYQCLPIIEAIDKCNCKEAVEANL